MKREIACSILILFTILVPYKFSYAGEINGPEQSVLSAARGTFAYEGKMYKAKASYLEQMRAKFARDDVDLTSEQASEAISQMYASIRTGIESGYLEEVSGTEKNETSDTNEKGVEIQEKSGKPAATQRGTKEPSLAEESEFAQGKMSSDKEDPEQAEGPKDTERGGSTSLGEMAKKGFGNDSLLFYARYILLAVAALALATALFVAMKFVWRKKYFEKKAGILCEKLGGFSDIHSHMLPGVDDGARTEEEAMRMVEEAYQNGIRKLFVTPHYMENHSSYMAQEIQQRFALFSKLVDEKYGQEMTLYLGNEIYFSDGVIQALKEGRALTMAGTRYVLVEFSTSIYYRDLCHAIQMLLRHSFIPILAHCERYGCLREDIERIRVLRKQGVVFQMNASSVERGGHSRNSFCRNLVKAHLIQFIGTDAHNLSTRPPVIRKGIEALLSDGVTEHRITMIQKRNFERLLENQFL